MRRKHIWADAKRALDLVDFNDSSGLNVTFIGESGQDAGGPTREFFRLVWVKIAQDGSLFAQDGSLFAGPEDTHLVQHNILALQKHEFEHVGQSHSSIADVWWKCSSFLF